MGLFDKLFKKKKPSISPEDAAKLLQLPFSKGHRTRSGTPPSLKKS